MKIKGRLAEPVFHKVKLPVLVMESGGLQERERMPLIACEKGLS